MGLKFLDDRSVKVVRSVEWTLARAVSFGSSYKPKWCHQFSVWACAYGNQESKVLLFCYTAPV